MALVLGTTVPDFTADSTTGSLNWHSYIDNSWAVLFSHPADFTPVCTTELGAVASIHDEFTKRGVKVAALSCDTTEHHIEWIKDIEATSYAEKSTVTYPIISDPNREIAVLYGMLDPAEIWWVTQMPEMVAPKSQIPEFPKYFLPHKHWGIQRGNCPLIQY